MSALTLLAVDLPIPFLAEKGKTTTLQVPIEISGALATVTALTVQLYDQNGVAVGSAINGTIPASIAQFDVADSVTTDVTLQPEPWRARMTATIAGATHIIDHELYVCARVPTALATQRAMTRRHRRLADMLASGNTLGDYIAQAFYDVEAKLLTSGKRPWCTWDNAARTRLENAMALVAVFRDLMLDFPDAQNYRDLKRDYEAEVRNAWAECSFRYDADQTNVYDNGSTTEAMSGGLWMTS